MASTFLHHFRKCSRCHFLNNTMIKQTVVTLLLISLSASNASYDQYDHEPSKVIEQTKPYHIPVVKKVGVPDPHPVHIPVPQVVKVGVPQPYPVHVSVPHPVEIPIYKLVPQEIEKKIPIHVNKLVPVYVKKPYQVILEKHYPVYIDKPYPVHVPIYKHVYHQTPHKSHSGFDKEHHEHH